MTAQELWFGKKLDVVNEEFDAYIGALVADLILRQHVLRTQSKKNYESHASTTENEISTMLREELNRTDHLVYVDTTLEISDEERHAIKNQWPIDYDQVVKRRS